MAAPMLPEPFADLAGPGGEWILPTEKARHDKRVTSDLQTVRTLYEAMLPRMDAIMTYLNTLPLGEMRPADRNLYSLALAFMEISHPIELNWKGTDTEGAFPSERLEFLSEGRPAAV